jgi:hypothetical protein
LIVTGAESRIVAMLPERFDIVEQSTRHAIAVSFPASRSAAYPSAVAIAKGAPHYTEGDVGGRVMHFAAFTGTRDGMRQAQALIQTMRGYKGLLIYAGGSLQQWARTLHVLRCYVDSTACADSRAHCAISVHKQSITFHGAGSGVFDITPDFLQTRAQGNAYLFPCRLLANNFLFKFQPGHPSSEEDQIQAAAVREGCSWCPNFNQWSAS